MAIESFFVVKSSFNRLKELLGDEIVRVDKEYDEITISYHGFFFWMYFYKEGEACIDEEEKAKLLVNIKAVKSLVVGNPVILIKNGKVNVANCAKVGISADQLMLHIRMEGLFSTKEVKSAIMETNGKLTIIDMQSATPKFPIISNGKINRDILEVIGHDEKWLLSSINEQGVENIQDIFLGEYVNGELNLTTYPKII